MNLWKKDGLKVALTDNGSHCVVTVQGAGIDDVINWKPSTDLDTPSLLEAKRGGKSLLHVSIKDKAPRGDKH